MTRVNAGIPAAQLTRQHIIAEHREITRIPNAIRNGRYHLKGIPPKFTLGTGHVKFFYDKLLYLKRRYITLYNECILRGYNVQNNVNSWDNIPENLMNDWLPTDEARSLVRERIAIRLEESQLKEKLKKSK
jgi:hypothetical protein